MKVIIDSREKHPLIFPDLLVWNPPGKRKRTFKIETEVLRIDEGDYFIAGYDHTVCVERKADIRELTGNFSRRDWSRFRRAFERFCRGTRFPILFIEELPSTWWTNDTSLEIGQTMDKLFHLLIAYDVQLLWGGRRVTTVAARRRLGEIVLRAMLARLDHEGVL